MAQQGASSSGGGYSQAKPAAQPSNKPAATPGSKPPPGGTGGKKYVRTQAGATRYKKPIGAEILPPSRDERGRAAQSDAESAGRYKGLVSQDPEAQRKAMQGLSEDQLKRLSEVAFSFNSSDPNVARLRAGVAIEMQRRSLDVNRHGGLSGRGPQGKAQGSTANGGGVEVINYTTGERYRVATKGDNKAAGQARTANNKEERLALHEAMMAEHKRQAEQLKAERKAESDRKAAERKAKSETDKKQRQADALARIQARNQGKYGKASGKPSRVVRLAIPDLTGLRGAIQALPKVRPDRRQQVAKLICQRAVELNAAHLLSSAVIELAHPTYHYVVELDGKWKHGWIPLDGAAVHAKTRGRQGAKPWWDKGSAGHHQAPGSGGSKGGGSGEKLVKVPAPGGGYTYAKKPTGLPPVGGTGDRTSVVKSGMTSPNPNAKAETAIHSAIHSVAGGPGNMARLHEVRAKLGLDHGMSQAAQDAHLQRMSKDGSIHLSPSSNSKALTSADHRAAIHIGNQDNHLIASKRGAKVETISRDEHFGKGTASKFERQPGESAGAYKARMAAATTQTPAAPTKPAAEWDPAKSSEYKRIKGKLDTYGGDRKRLTSRERQLLDQGDRIMAGRQRGGETAVADKLANRPSAAVPTRSDRAAQNYVSTHGVEGAKQRVAELQKSGHTDQITTDMIAALERAIANPPAAAKGHPSRTIGKGGGAGPKA